MQKIDSSKIFTCPFNPYHKLMEFRKWQFHVTRCGDRRGKTVYQCQYQTSHFFCDIADLLDHENNKCEFRETQKATYDNSDPEVAKSRQPVQVYCKYEVGHVFGSISECYEHMKDCPKKEEHCRKMEQCHQKFSQNKKWIRAAQEAKRVKESELGGNTNAPDSRQMPNLRYQYMMNEPFVGGYKSTVQASHEANVHKRRVAYELDLEDERMEQTMTIEDQKDRLNRELCSKIDTDIKSKGQTISTDDVDTLVVTNEENKPEFGLKITERREPKMTLFQYNTEKFIPLDYLCHLTNLDIDDFTSITNFLLDNYLLKLSVLTDNDIRISADARKEYWREKALGILDDFQLKHQLGNDESQNTIHFNTIQGPKLNFGIENQDDSHDIFLFIISKESGPFGKQMQIHFPECDFMLVKFERLKIKDEIKEDSDLERIKESRELDGMSKKVKGDPVLTQQISALNDERTDLEERLKLHIEEIKRLTIELDTANKSIYDKERGQKQDKRDIMHLENSLRHNKTKQQELCEVLNIKERDLKNSVKYNDDLKADIKKLELRFEKQKQRTDEFQNKYNETILKFEQAQGLLTNANKVVRNKDNEIEQLRHRVIGYEKIMNQYAGSNVPSQLGNRAQESFILKGNEPQIQPQKIPLKRENPELEDVKVDDEGIEDAELISDEEDLDEVNRNKAQYDLQKLHQAQEAFASGPVKDQEEESEATPQSSVHESKTKDANKQEESELPSATGSKKKEIVIDIDSKTQLELREILLCVCCMEKPRCMLIDKCKHVPFCKSCEKDWRLQRAGQNLECPICRKEYKKTTAIQII